MLFQDSKRTRRKWLSRWLMAGALAIAAPVAYAPSALADETTTQAKTEVKVEVVVIHALKEGVMNSKLKPDLVKALGQDPFSGYKGFTLLTETSLPLMKTKSGTVGLPSNQTLQITFADTIAAKDKKDVPRYIVNASIQRPNAESPLQLLKVEAKAGQYFFVAGTKHQGGILILAMRVIA